MLTIRQVAARLGMSISFVRSQVRLGELEAYRFGNRLRIREADLDLFIEMHAFIPDEGQPAESQPEQQDREALWQALQADLALIGEEDRRALLARLAGEAAPAPQAVPVPGGLPWVN